MKLLFRFLNSRFLNVVYPLADFLYILQLEEYKNRFFLHWALPRIYKRNFQKIGNLSWSEKAKALYLLSSFLIAVLSFFISIFLPLFGKWVYTFFVLLILNFTLIPFWLIAASILLMPLEHYFKQKQVKNAKKKLLSLKGLKVIAIAGSAGKTSTRHFLSEILKNKYRVFTPTKNYNTLLGIAEQVNNQMPQDTEVFIVELGEYLPGDLMIIAQLVNPEVLILTKVTNQHFEKFGSQEAINEEFLSLSSFPTIKNIFIAKDNLITKNLTGKSKVNLVDTKKWGLYLDKIKNINLPWALSVYENLSITAAVSDFMGVRRDSLKNTVRQLMPVDRRLVVSSQNGVTIIDDSYNISFDSAKNAFEFLKSFKGRKVLVSGGIVEQGKNATVVNQEFGQMVSRFFDIAIIAKNNFYKAVTTGIKESKNKTQIFTSDKPDKTPLLLTEILRKGDVVLVQNELPEVYWH